MKSKLKFAILGCGSIAQRHASLIHAYAQLVAVCDIVNTKAAALAGQYNCRFFSSIDALLEMKEIEVVCVCTPNGLHAQHSMAALAAGYHVLVEKPMGLTVFDCAAMIATAKKAEKELFVVKQNRYNSAVLAVKEALDKNLFGKIYSVQLSCFWNRDHAYYENDWKGTKQLDGGILFTQFSHFIDILYWLIGDVQAATTVTANFAHQQITEFEDAGVVLLEFCNGAIGTINYTTNSFARNMEGSLTIIAEKGTVKIGGEYLNRIEYQSMNNFQFNAIALTGEANDYHAYKGSMNNHHKVYEHVISVLEKKQPISTNTFDAMKTVEIINKINQSVKKNQSNDAL